MNVKQKIMNFLLKRLFYTLKVCIDFIDIFLFKITRFRLISLNYENFLNRLSIDCRGQIKGTIAERALKILLKDLDNCLDLSVTGRFLLRENFLQTMENRCNLHRIVRRNSAIRDVPLENPVAILTLPRTGSTFFHCLLAKDKRWKTPELWEMLKIAPLPEDPLTLKNRRDMIDMQKKFRFFSSLYSKNFKIAHPTHARNPEDLRLIMSQQGIDPVIATMFNLPNYDQFLRNLTFNDWQEIYKHIKLYFQAIGYKQNLEKRRLLFMIHLNKYLNLEALKNVFPESKFITLHRDPVVSCQSWFSLLISTTGVTYNYSRNPRNLKHIIDSIFNHFIEGSKKLAEFKIDSNHIHIPFSELRLNPLNVIKQAYIKLNMDWTDELEKTILNFINNQTDHRCGVHKYTYMNVNLQNFAQNIRNYKEIFKEYIK